MKHPRTWIAVATVALLAGLAAPAAEAVTLTYSDKTGKMTQLWQFRGAYDLPFNIQVLGGLTFAPDLTSIVAPAGTTPSTVGTLGFSYDNMLDLDLNVGYKFTVFEVDTRGLGNIVGSVVPFMGYRQLWTNTGSAALGTGLSNSGTTLSGLNYGANFHVELPLGFSGNFYVGGSNMLGGSSNSGGTATPIDTKGIFLPQFGLNGAWRFPFWDIASIYLGYSGTLYPEDLRTTTTLSGKGALVSGVTVGVRLLWLSL